ncbi:MAG: RNA polymerase sigma factor, partial [Roseburia sp.]
DLKAALDTLSKEDKAVVELRYFEEMKLEEIAEILNENVNTVKSRLYRSIRKLRLKLVDDADEAESGSGTERRCYHERKQKTGYRMEQTRI